MKQARVNNYEDVQSILKDINWNFYQTFFSGNGELNPFDTRKHIAYPSTYVPEIPFTLIDVLTKPGASVLDPFSGSGTTFFQALILNRTPYVSDICEVSIEFARSLYILFNKNHNLRKIPSQIRQIAVGYDPFVNYSNQIAKKFPFIEILRGWYAEQTFNMLCYLFKEMDKLKDDSTKAALNIALMSLTKYACSQDRGWGCIADNMIPKKNQLKEKNVFKTLINKVNVLINDIENRTCILDTKYKNLYDKSTSAKLFFHGDVRNWQEIKIESIDCIITSPPYPNMTDYITSQRLNYYFLNSDPDIEKFKETGARFRRARIYSNDEYFRDISMINIRLAEILKPGGYLCLILPEFDTFHKRDAKRKNIIQNLIDNLENIGLVKRDIFERILPSMTRSHNQKWATLKKEKIYIYQKIAK